MPIPDKAIAQLEEAAAVEVATAKLPFAEQINAIERYFDQLEQRANSGFVARNVSRNHNLVMYKTPLGRIVLTRTKGELVISKSGDDIKVIQFFSSSDETASLLSATVRFVGRMLAFTKATGLKLTQD